MSVGVNISVRLFLFASPLDCRRFVCLLLLLSTSTEFCYRCPVLYCLQFDIFLETSSSFASFILGRTHTHTACALFTFLASFPPLVSFGSAAVDGGALVLGAETLMPKANASTERQVHTRAKSHPRPCVDGCAPGSRFVSGASQVFRIRSLHRRTKEHYTTTNYKFSANV